MKIYFDALGCPKALVDAERMNYFLEKESHELILNPEEAEVIIINTCGFIEKAKKESINAILSYIRLKKNNPELKIIISGCLTERYKKELLEALPEVDNAIGVRNIAKITDALDFSKNNNNRITDDGDFRNEDYTIQRSLKYSGLYYAYIKIAEGCNRNCSFCTIPNIRGKYRSRTIENILSEAEFLINQGIRELILVSEDNLYYGTDIYGRKALKNLLESLIPLGFDWIRIMYLYPEEEILDIAELMNRTACICNYIDIPLQHASKNILNSMHRTGSFENYIKLFSKMREINPDIKIRTSFILGYPGETESDFEILKNLIKEVQFDRIGFFEYSREEGTVSYNLKNRINKRIVKERINELSHIQEGISIINLKKLIGKTLTCINDGIEHKIHNKMFAALRSEYDAPEIDGNVYIELSSRNKNLIFNKEFVKVKIEGNFSYHDLSGSIVID